MARPPEVAAQRHAPVPVGADVRVRAEPAGAWRRGELLALDGERLVLGPDGFGWRVRADTIALVRVERLEVRRPTADRTARTVTGALVGGVVGALVGGFVGRQATACSGCDDPGFGVVYGAPLGGLLGVVVGAGVAKTRAHYWEPVPLAGWPAR